MAVSLSNSVKNNTLWNTLQQIRTQSVAATLANATAVTIDLRKWARQVSHDPQTVYTNLINIPSYELVKLPYTVVIGNNVICENKQNLEFSPETFDPTDVTFAIVTIQVKNLEILPFGLNNHVVYAYLHRYSIDDEWKVVICDPNYDNHTSLKDQIKLYKLGQYVLSKVAFSWNRDSIKHIKELIELHRCINVNRCVPNVGEGICFTGICATLLVTTKYCESNGIKAHNGNELMHLILQASAVGRSIAPSLVSRMHLGRGARGLSQIMRAKTMRSISPFKQAFRPQSDDTSSSISSTNGSSETSSSSPTTQSSSLSSTPESSITSPLPRMQRGLFGRVRRRHALSPPRVARLQQREQ